ncbi:nicotinate phosphoribosyltransferase [Candidatus Kuenenbacteria bacterium CG11_big_fil_rev_8_21_14_0_20_37_9]|uniref:Nicotinate phosphoribosyltransferase n=1 Tax=Candidatus Kuenenbacteria bacterium CG08_land_8_20_14_0_20_37_23 TaxID=1974617 RepID=A0A2M6XTK2_9BACT|nr:MAG: nicotinate phosphoribosyltransferase [Candidatus Kuenenbacteria bacterium CG11_big_fil_rev_8_21_14_0_20_37_9]PIU10978.1 MAG: nicotinate phosphoribosyltransferase [Candidatus Kuenenbacteria bacterium CG08_land_8_20_14_0_20_37_23]
MKKISTIPTSHFFGKNDLHLFDLKNIFTACSLWLENGMENYIVTYDLFVRDMPKHRNFLIFGGLEEIVMDLKNWKYSKGEIDFLKKSGLATPKLVNYLKKFKFKCDVRAMPEGTIFFQKEPVIRITGPICDGNLLTNFLCTAVFGNTAYMSKIIRSRIAVGNKKYITGSGMRINSFEAGMKVCRSAYAVAASSNYPAFCQKFKVSINPASINAYHAIIKSFPSEKEAFMAAARLFPNNARVMVDTYDFKKGIKNVIAVSAELTKENNEIVEINIDSGDLYGRSVYARKQFDKHGLQHIKILAYSNLDEYKILALEKRKAPIDTYVTQTEVCTLADSPKIEVVYKLAEVKNGSQIRPVAKLTKGKESYPGKKQVYRNFINHNFAYDVLGLENEKRGLPLLKKIFDHGKLVHNLPNLFEISKYVDSQLAHLPKKYLAIDREYKYPVKISPKLEKLINKTKKQIQRAYLKT